MQAFFVHFFGFNNYKNFLKYFLYFKYIRFWMLKTSSFYGFPKDLKSFFEFLFSISIFLSVYAIIMQFLSTLYTKDGIYVIFPLTALYYARFLARKIIKSFFAQICQIVKNSRGHYYASPYTYVFNHFSTFLHIYLKGERNIEQKFRFSLPKLCVFYNFPGLVGNFTFLHYLLL